MKMRDFVLIIMLLIIIYGYYNGFLPHNRDEAIRFYNNLFTCESFQQVIAN